MKLLVISEEKLEEISFKLDRLTNDHYVRFEDIKANAVEVCKEMMEATLSNTWKKWNIKETEGSMFQFQVQALISMMTKEEN